MKCPFCGQSVSKVLDSRPVVEQDAIRRRRQCDKCNRRFTTYEKVEDIPLIVIKKDKSCEVFDRQKLFKGILRSCNKRPVSMEKIEGLVNEIEKQISEDDHKEVTSTIIGELTMQRLRLLDEVSYIRFASVYKAFGCIDEFIVELEHIKKMNETL